MAWQKVCAERPTPFTSHDEIFGPFQRLIDKENERFPTIPLPLYQDMVEIFTKNFWLAEEDTREFYKPTCRYVELWERYYQEAIPRQVLEEVPITETPLHPFYDNLELHLNRLRSKVAKGEDR